LSTIWNKLIDCQNQIIDLLDSNANEYIEVGLGQFNRDNWVNRTWVNSHIRRAHIDVVDARDTKGLWMMHVCMFPITNNSGPIYGFDVIAGKNKITGAFHDFSETSGGIDHPMIQGFEESVRDYIPTKKRVLPEWASNIFTPWMISASNVSNEEEVDQIINIVLSNTRYYLEEIPKYSIYQDVLDIDYTKKMHNYYCTNQQMNPHTPAVMKSLGLPETDVEIFCRDLLFPKL
jgi:phycocyanobilin:ferredoxin oxidoreductase|tara:strand:- start:97 stop:792 length:696 start_codon:yes stop_codon:yes gene_type:complete